MALDKDGRPVTDLKAEDVRVLEDKVEQKITSVLPVANEPLTMGLFFDISGSRRADRSINEEVRLTREFVHTVWHEGDAGFVLAFSGEVFVVTQPTHTLEDVDDGLSKIPDATYWGSTALYDALCTLKADKLNGIPGRKIYVVLSDFDDNSSKNKLANVVELAHAARLAIFPVVLREGFGGGGYPKKVEKRGRESAQKIAQETGAEVLIPESPKQLGTTFERITNELRASYRIIYTPSSLGGDRRKKKLNIETTRPRVTLLFARN
jgi:VWFA-related protein